MGKKILFFFSTHLVCPVPDMVNICDVFLESKISHINVVWLLWEAEIPHAPLQIMSSGNATVCTVCCRNEIILGTLLLYYLRSDSVKHEPARARGRHTCYSGFSFALYLRGLHHPHPCRRKTLQSGLLPSLMFTRIVLARLQIGELETKKLRICDE